MLCLESFENSTFSKKLYTFIPTEKSSKSKKNCQLCQEKKKKPLTSYIKQRNNTQRFNSICEEEDEKPETPNQQTQQNEQQASKK